MDQVALDVPAMCSQDCERAVTTALINVPGVHWATAAYRKGVVGVQFDPSVTDVTDLLEAVEAAGYVETH